MKLYSAALSPFTAKVRIALYEKEIPFEKVTLPWSPATGITGKPPEMLAINPKAQVPTMIDGDIKLYDSTIILEYLEERYPKPALFPASLNDRVLCRLLEDAGDTIIADSMARLARELFAKTDPATRDQAAIAKATSELRQAYAVLDQDVASRPYLCGTFSVADISCFIPINIASLMGVAPEEKHIAAWFSRMRERPSVKRDLDEQNQALAALAA
jgi:glutathione S-transferase